MALINDTNFGIDAVAPRIRRKRITLLPMATVEGATHLVRDINPDFCRLIDKIEGDVVGKSFCELLPETDECLFNRTFQKQPGRLRRQNIPTAPANKLIARLECLDYLLASRGLSHRAVAKVQAILSRFADVALAEVGY